MPHPRDGDHFQKKIKLLRALARGAWILRGAEGREATGTTRAGVEEADRPVPPLAGLLAMFVLVGGRVAKRCSADWFRCAPACCRVWKISSEIRVEALAPYRRPLRSEDRPAHDALLGIERSQGHRTSTLGCLDECQPGSGWHARCDCVAVAASHRYSADEATHHHKQSPRLASKRARRFYPRR